MFLAFKLTNLQAQDSKSVQHYSVPKQHFPYGHDSLLHVLIGAYSVGKFYFKMMQKKKIQLRVQMSYI